MKKETLNTSQFDIFFLNSNTKGLSMNKNNKLLIKTKDIGLIKYEKNNNCRYRASTECNQ